MRTDRCSGRRGGESSVPEGVSVQGGFPQEGTEWLTYASENITFPGGR